jgi:hypothetical protein
MSDKLQEPMSAAPAKPPKGRSPNYPGISLPSAIARASTIYGYAQQHQVPIKVVMVDKWKYKSTTTGPGTVTYAALKKYGLLADEGSGNNRTARVTDLAVEILRPNPNQQQAIQTAALLPPTIREWWEKYGFDLPPDETLQWEHVVKGPFTENGLGDFLRVYRETIAFAKLDPSARLDRAAEQEGDGSDGEQDFQNPPDPDEQRPPKPVRRPPRAEGVVTYSVPLKPGSDIVVEFPYPPTGDDWEYFVGMLGAVRSRLVVQPDRGDAPPASNAEDAVRDARSVEEQTRH